MSLGFFDASLWERAISQGDLQSTPDQQEGFDELP